MGIIHAVKCHYRKHHIQKALAMIDGELLGDAVSPDLRGRRRRRRRRVYWEQSKFLDAVQGLDAERKLIQQMWRKTDVQ
jgi:hypothetical protein